MEPLLEAGPWLFAVLGGAVILGLLLVYGIVRGGRATRREQDEGERKTRDLYHKEDHKS